MEPALAQAPLGLVVDEREGAAEGSARLRGAPQAAQQLAARRVQVAVVVELEAIDDVEPRLGAVGLGDGHGPAELDDGGVGQARQLAVERGDLRHVAGLVEV